MEDLLKALKVLLTDLWNMIERERVSEVMIWDFKAKASSVHRLHTHTYISEFFSFFEVLHFNHNSSFSCECYLSGT